MEIFDWVLVVFVVCFDVFVSEIGEDFVIL